MGIPTNATALQEVKTVVDSLKKDGYRAIMKRYQNEGTREDYMHAFAYDRFTDETFWPVYDLNPYSQWTSSGAYYMFAQFNKNRTPFNLKTRLEECGVKLNTSRAISVHGMFYQSNITEIPTLDISNCTASSFVTRYMFYQCPYLATVEKIITSAETFFNRYTFSEATGLKNVKIEGIIQGGNELNLRWSKNLTKDSITSFVQALSLESAPYSAIFSLTAVNKAFETSLGANDGSSSTEWAALIATRPLWTIILGD